MSAEELEALQEAEAERERLATKAKRARMTRSLDSLGSAIQNTDLESNNLVQPS